MRCRIFTDLKRRLRRTRCWMTRRWISFAHLSKMRPCAQEEQEGQHCDLDNHARHTAMYLHTQAIQLANSSSLCYESVASPLFSYTAILVQFLENNKFSWLQRVLEEQRRVLQDAARPQTPPRNLRMSRVTTSLAKIDKGLLCYPVDGRWLSRRS